MKKLLILIPLMAATMATTGCNPHGRHSLPIALDSDTIVIPKPKVVEPQLPPAAADSDSTQLIKPELPQG